MRNLHRLWSIALGLGVAGAAAAQIVGNPVAGQQKAMMCEGCHGNPDYRTAYPVYHVPKLGGQHAQYLVDALKEYQSGQRSNTTMRAIAASLSAQDMADLAAYFSGPKKGPPEHR